MSLADAIRDHVREHRSGMLFDFVFAVVWVTLVSLLFDVLQGPQWAYYLALASGVAAYYGFVWSLSAAKEAQADRE
jgi:hypothetical protein